MDASSIYLSVVGFSIGFVGWINCYLLTKPMGAWLLGSEKNKKNTCKVRVFYFIVFLFLVSAVLIALMLLPTIFAIGANHSIEVWANNFSIMFISSLVGLITVLIFRKKEKMTD